MMGGQVHEWETTYSQGVQFEEELDNYFSEWYQIESVSRSVQRQGIDRVFHRSDGTSVMVEYKADSRAADTGNAYVETVSVDTAGKAGWAHTSRSDVLAYFVPPMQKVYLAWMKDIRERLPEWAGRFRSGRSRNRGYSSRGLLVPLGVFEGACFGVRDVGLDTGPVSRPETG